MSASANMPHLLRLVHKTPGHGDSLLIRALQLQRNQTFTDVTIQVAGSQYYGHKAILAACSDYFLDTLSNNNLSVLILEDINPVPFQHLFNYCYTSELDIAADEVASIYKLAVKLRISGAIKACSEFLINNITVKTALSIRECINCWSDPVLSTAIDKYIVENVNDICTLPLLKEVPRIIVDILAPPLGPDSTNDEEPLDMKRWQHRLHELSLQWLEAALNVKSSQQRVCASVGASTRPASVASSVEVDLTSNEINGAAVALENSNGLSCDSATDDGINFKELASQVHMLYLTPGNLLVDCRQLSLQEQSVQATVKNLAFVRDYVDQRRGPKTCKLLPATSTSANLTRSDCLKPLRHGHTALFTDSTLLDGGNAASSREENRLVVTTQLDDRCPENSTSVCILRGHLLLLSLSVRRVPLNENSIEDPNRQYSDETAFSVMHLIRQQSLGEAVATSSTNAAAILIDSSKDDADVTRFEEDEDNNEATKTLTSTNVGTLKADLAGILDQYPSTFDIQNRLSPCSANMTVASNLYRVNRLESLALMTTPRCAVGIGLLGNHLHVIGGYNRGECLYTVESYNMNNNSWYMSPSLPGSRGRFPAVLLAGQLFVCGGSDGGHDLREVHSWQGTAEAPWQRRTGLLHKRSCAGAAVLHNCIYVAGGRSGSKTLRSVECFDPAEDRWLELEPMITARSEPAVEVLNDKLYAIGGVESWSGQCLSSVEVYEPETQCWSPAPAMNHARRGAGVVIFNGKLFVIGGSDGQICLTSCEIFDPVSQSWSKGPSLNVPRANVATIVMRGRIFAVGGFSGRTFLDSMEQLDADNGAWSMCVPLFRSERHSSASSSASQ